LENESSLSGVQQDGKIIEEISILKGELKKVKLLKGYELYLDPNL
jgi:hypothetical protein